MGIVASHIELLLLARQLKMLCNVHREINWLPRSIGLAWLKKLLADDCVVCENENDKRKNSTYHDVDSFAYQT